MTATNMARSHGRCQRGERLRIGFPHGHRKTTTLVAGLRKTGMVAPMTLDGPINGDWLDAYVRHVLVPALRPGDVVIMDNLTSHKRASVQDMIEAAGARLMFLPPYTRWQLVANDGTGAPTLTDMGASFAIATDGVLTLFIAAAPNGSSVWVRVVDEVTGAVLEQEITADVPANIQFLSPRLFMNNGATAAAVAYDCSGVYVETDY